MPGPAPCVSVIVPTYDYARFLPDAIASLLAQSLEDWEAVVVDDGSTDDTAELMSTFLAGDSRLRYIRRPHGGVSAARNHGLAVTTGRYVQFLDADDTIERDKLRAQANFLDEHHEIAIVYGDAAVLGGHAEVVPLSPLQLGGPIGFGASAIRPLVTRNPLVIHAPLSRRSAIENAGAFREGAALLEDWELWLHCALGGSAFGQLVEPRTRALVRVHEAGASRRPDLLLAASVDVRTRIAPELPARLRRLNNHFLARAQTKLALNLLRQGRPRAALTQLRQIASRILRARA
jgi:glycosyltransferase involved in cell wall biosynthesis